MEWPSPPGQAAGVGSSPIASSSGRHQTQSAPCPSAAHNGAALRRQTGLLLSRWLALWSKARSWGCPPREAVEQTRELISKHYDNALEGMTVPTDVARHQLDSQFQSILADNPMMTSKAFKHMRQYVANRFDNMRNNGVMHLDGPMLKQIDSEIGGQASLAEQHQCCRQTAAPAWRDLQQAVRDVMESGAGSPEQVTQPSQANAATDSYLRWRRRCCPAARHSPSPPPPHWRGWVSKGY